MFDESENYLKVPHFRKFKGQETEFHKNCNSSQSGVSQQLLNCPRLFPHFGHCGQALLRKLMLGREASTMTPVALFWHLPVPCPLYVCLRLWALQTWACRYVFDNLSPSTPTHPAELIIFPFQKTYVAVLPACMSIYHVCAVSTEPRRRHWMP